MSPEEYPVEHSFDIQAILIRENLIAELKGRVAELEKRNADLEAQVAALKKIAEDERAYILSVDVMESTGVDEFLRTEARRQLAEEHPEAFR